MNDDKKTNEYIQMGIAALLPGMQYLIDKMQAQIDDFRQELARLQGTQPKKLGRPPKERPQNVESPARSRGSASYWAKMTPKERSAEMRRRQQVAAGVKPGRKMPPKAEAKPLKLHPRDPRHPGHAAYLKNLGKSSRNYWKNMTVAERKARLDKMAAGRGFGPVKLEKAS